MSLRDLTSPSLCAGSSSSGPSSLSTLADSLLPSSSTSPFPQTAQPSSSTQLSPAEHALLHNDPRGLGLDLRGGATHRFEQAWRHAPMPPPMHSHMHAPPPQSSDVSRAWVSQRMRGGLADEFARMSMGATQKHNASGAVANTAAVPPTYGMMSHGGYGYGMSWRGAYSGMMSHRMQMASNVQNAGKEEESKEEEGALKESGSWGEGFTSLEGSVERGDVQGMNGEEEFQRMLDLAYREYAGDRGARQEYRFGEREKQVGKSALEALQIGERAREEGKLREAIKWFEEALDRKTDDPFPALERDMKAKAWMLLGKTLAESDEDETAIIALQTGVNLYQGSTQGSRREDHPFLLESLMCLAVSFTNELDQAQAVTHIQEWFTTWKRVHGVATIARSEHLQDGNEERYTNATKSAATRLLSEMRVTAQERSSSEDTELYVMLGVLHNVHREYGEATEWLKRAAVGRPQDAGVWNKLGATLSNSGNAGDALRAYRRAVDLKPMLVRAWVNVGTAYANRQEHAKAVRYYLKSIGMGDAGERMGHVWGYVRTSLIGMGRGDVLDAVDRRDLQGLRREFGF